MELPVFPLRTVLFPGGVLPLRIFETRYLDMVGRCLRDATPFVVACLREGAETGPARYHLVGTTAHIVDFDRTPEGLLAITAQGAARVRLAAPRTAADGLHLAQATHVAEPAPLALAPEDRRLAALALQLIDGLGPPFAALERHEDEGGWVAARLAELLPLDLALKQRLLEMDDAGERLAVLRPLVRALSAE